MAITRESLMNGYLQKRLQGNASGLHVLTEEELTASRTAVLADVGPDQDIWLFAYGSLMWNPAFHYAERCRGKVWGYHRRFAFWVPDGRGTQEQPGLMLALDRGGSCQGVIYRITPEQRDLELGLVWRREMVVASYIPRWVQVDSPAGRIRALTFVVNPEMPLYAGRLCPGRTVEALARACGWLGSSADYLFDLIQHLDELQIRDQPLHHLYRQVRSRMAELGIEPPRMAGSVSAD